MDLIVDKIEFVDRNESIAVLNKWNSMDELISNRDISKDPDRILIISRWLLSLKLMVNKVEESRWFYPMDPREDKRELL